MPANSSSRIIRFSTFEVNLQTGELRQRGQKLKLQEQPFQVLAALLERPGELITREELRSKLWPADTFVDFDHSLNAAIKRLRDALGESADAPVFIETMARRGYRFIAPVDIGSAASGIGIAAPERTKSSLLRPRVVLGLLSLIVVAVLVWAVWRYSWRRSEVIESKLTTNSSENSVSGAAISPDGKYLAYSDHTGVYLKLIRTGETHAVPLPRDFSARVDDWFPDGSHILVSRAEAPGKASLWIIAMFGGSPRKLADDAAGGSVSPDGAHIAFDRGDLSYVGLWAREEWVMGSDGTNPVKVAADKSDGSWVGAPTWSPDGKQIAYIRTIFSLDAPRRSVEINEWKNASAETLFSDGRLGSVVHWLHDGRLIYALGSTQPQQDSGLWIISLQQSRRISSSPKRIAGGYGWFSRVTGSADGKSVIFVRGNRSPSVYIGTLASNGTQLLAHKKLTLDESMNLPFSWTPDSKAVLFSSNRNGTPVIFKQRIDEPLAEILVTSADQVSQPRMTPDGSEILYISTPTSAGPETPSSIFAIPIGGGTPRLVLKDIGIYAVECASSPSTTCLYSIEKGENLETFLFDVRSGKRAESPQIDPHCNWSLSPDGLLRAIVVYGPNEETVRLRSTSTGKSRDLVVKGWSGLKNIDWSADGRSLLVSWHDFQRDSALLKVTLDGKAAVLLHSNNPEVFYAIPSPDRQLLAIAEAGSTQNAWQLENF
jgi:DNA-binding winged helix-turn-helix (wHTH) protein/Tol biopolymer transport system component